MTKFLLIAFLAYSTTPHANDCMFMDDFLSLQAKHQSSSEVRVSSRYECQEDKIVLKLDVNHQMTEAGVLKFKSQVPHIICDTLSDIRRLAQYNDDARKPKSMMFTLEYPDNRSYNFTIQGDFISCGI